MLYLRDSHVKDDILTALNLPALQSLDIIEFSFWDDDEVPDSLLPDQLCCPQLSCLVYEFCDTSQEALASEDGVQRCSLLHLTKLATLDLMCFHKRARMDVSLPASLEHLTLREGSNTDSVDLNWALLEAVKCIRSGAQLRSLTSADSVPSSHPEGMPWGSSSLAHYREFAEQLRGLKDLTIQGSTTTLLSAIAAVACSAPDLTRLEFGVGEELNDLELPPISSASLQTVSGRFHVKGLIVPFPPVILKFQPGCTELRDVHVQFFSYLDPPNNRPKITEGTSVKICCHSTSERCIRPFDACAGVFEVGVRFLPMPPSSQDVQAYTVTFTCHAAGPEEALQWGHVVTPGIL